MAFIFLFLKYLQHSTRMREQTSSSFKCYQVNPEIKQDGVKEAAEMSENSVGLQNNTLTPLLSNPRDNDKTNLTFKVANEQARQNLWERNIVSNIDILW